MNIEIKREWKPYFTGENESDYRDFVNDYVSGHHKTTAQDDHRYYKGVKHASDLTKFITYNKNLYVYEIIDMEYLKGEYALTHVKPELWSTDTWLAMMDIALTIKYLTGKVYVYDDIKSNINAHLDFYCNGFVKSQECNGVKPDDAVDCLFNNMSDTKDNCKIEFESQD